MIKAGLFQMMYGSPGDDVPGLYRDVIEQIEVADDLGYDAIWLVEHHFVRSGEFFSRLPAPLTFASAVARTTRNIRLGTAVKVLPIDNPLFVAEEAAVIDILSDGRLNLGVGTGLVTDYPIFGTPSEDRGERLREMIDLLLTAWEGKEFDYRGTFYTLEGITLSPTPVQDPRSLVWLASRDEQTIRWGARRGLALLMGQIESVDVHKTYVDAYLDEHALAAVATAPRIYGTRLCYVGESTDAARREIEPAVYRYYNRFRQHPVYLGMLRDGYLRDDGRLTFDQILHNLGFVVGDPESVTRRMQDIIDYLQLTGINCMTHISGVAQDHVLRSMRLFATEVMPKLRPAAQPAPVDR
ncbi:MAG TPA: LLM class flavin-dependent oxidoreductase [Dehalococcoidia bacterium]|nr:LLM class flavin-dependent oxidoreductase [Dehalococcoidia bacterium]